MLPHPQAAPAYCSDRRTPPHWSPPGRNCIPPGVPDISSCPPHKSHMASTCHKTLSSTFLKNPVPRGPGSPRTIPRGPLPELLSLSVPWEIPRPSPAANPPGLLFSESYSPAPCPYPCSWTRSSVPPGCPAGWPDTKTATIRQTETGSPFRISFYPSWAAPLPDATGCRPARSRGFASRTAPDGIPAPPPGTRLPRSVPVCTLPQIPSARTEALPEAAPRGEMPPGRVHFLPDRLPWISQPRGSPRRTRRFRQADRPQFPPPQEWPAAAAPDSGSAFPTFLRSAAARNTGCFRKQKGTWYCRSAGRSTDRR